MKRIVYFILFCLLLCTLLSCIECGYRLSDFFDYWLSNYCFIHRT